jgi:hypothetical protein
MGAGSGRRARPLWVRVTLWGLPTRSAAWACAWLCLALALASAAYATIAHDGRWLVGGILVLGAVGYCLAIRWVDHNGSWS